MHPQRRSDALRRRWPPLPVPVSLTWRDRLRGAASFSRSSRSSRSLSTQRRSSPFFLFFVFAITTSGFRWGLRMSTAITALTVVLYLSLLLVSAEGVKFYVMRPVYLVVVGYLIGYLGQSRVRLEEDVRRLEADLERRGIAASLHDGSLQTLAGVRLRLEACRQLVSDGRREDALGELAALQLTLKQAHDELRSYIRSLAGRRQTAPVDEGPSDTRVSVNFAGSIARVDDVFQMLREALTNVRRHAHARSARIAVEDGADQLHLVIDDDAEGFPEGAAPPWSIGAHAQRVGGAVQLKPGGAVTRLRIAIPQHR